MLPPRIPMKITGKITVKAIESGLLTARRTSRQAMAKVALASRPRRLEMPLAGDGGGNGRGGHAAVSSAADAAGSVERRSST